MIHLCLESMPHAAEAALSELATYQRAVDAAGSYAERVKTAKDHWERKRQSQPFSVVREMLAGMCSGIRRCMYCEDSARTDVEHFWPKSLYPELVFVWMNYLYACKGCNDAKGAKFKVYQSKAEIVDVSRKRGVPPSAPPLAGAPLLLDPRHDEPLQFMDLVLTTGMLIEREVEGSLGYSRATYTIEALGLNDRELPEMRRIMYTTYRSLLERYVSEKKTLSSTEEKDKLRETRSALQRHSHRTVWEEMKRQRTLIPALGALFDAAPEALHW